MGKKILIVSGGRSEGNTLAAANAVAEGARSAGADVTVIECVKLSGIGVGCISCGSCRANGDFKCVLNDKTAQAVATLPQYDLVVLATPIYWFSYSTKLKGFIDRFYSLANYEGNDLITPLAGKEFALVATSEGGETDSGITAVRSSFRQMLDFLGAKFAGELHLAGCGFDPLPLRADAAKLNRARDFGHRIGQ